MVPPLTTIVPFSDPLRSPSLYRTVREVAVLILETEFDATAIISFHQASFWHIRPSNFGSQLKNFLYGVYYLIFYIQTIVQMLNVRLSMHLFPLRY